MASEMWGRAVVSWDAVVFAPPQITRFPFAVHLAADMRTCVGLVRSKAALMVAQMSSGLGLSPSDQVYVAVSTTTLGRCGVAAFAAYVGDGAWPVAGGAEGLAGFAGGMDFDFESFLASAEDLAKLVSVFSRLVRRF
jgi:hypothetical protein